MASWLVKMVVILTTSPGMIFEVLKDGIISPTYKWELLGL